MYDKKFASKEERLANLHVIVTHLANEASYRPEVKNTLKHYINVRDQLSMELEHMYCERFNKTQSDVSQFKTLLARLKEPINSNKIDPITTLIKDDRIPIGLRKKIEKLNNKVVDLQSNPLWNDDTASRLALAEIDLDEAVQDVKKYIKP